MVKQDLIDLRIQKMGEMGGSVLKNNFRKKETVNSTKSKFETIIKTREDLDREAQEAEAEMKLDQLPKRKISGPKKQKKEATMDDLMQLEKLTIGKKKKKQQEEDMEMDAVPKTKAISKPKKHNKSKKMYFK